MKRNFGSLNLAALDLNSPFNTKADSSSLEDRFSAMDPSAEDYSMDGSEYGSDENAVGFPLESMDQPAASMHSASQDADMDMEDVMPELELPARRPRSESGGTRTSRLVHPSSSSEVPQHLHEQHHVELNALRCLSLKVMLSASKPNYSYSPGVNDRAKTALLPIRHPSLQSV